MVKELPAPLVPVAVERGLGPFPAVKEHGFAAGMVSAPVLVGVIESEAETPRQGQRRRVLGVNELRVLLRDLPVREVPAQRPYPAAGHRVVLVNMRLDAVTSPKPVSTAKAGYSRPDYDDSGRAAARAGRLPAARCQG